MTRLTRIILASASPRRRELLARAGYAFDIVVSDADETVPPGLTPLQAAQHTARAKALAVARDTAQGALVIGADTIVVLDGRIFGKPRDVGHACQMLRELSGKTHQVITGVCLTEGSSDSACTGTAAENRVFKTFAEVTDVTFRPLPDAEIEGYIATGEPMDKAGAYGIQGLGGALVDHIEGDFDNVVGLPVSALAEQLRAVGLEPES